MRLPGNVHEGVMGMFCILVGLEITWGFIYIKTHQALYLGYEHLIVYKLYVNSNKSTLKIRPSVGIKRRKIKSYFETKIDNSL